MKNSPDGKAGATKARMSTSPTKRGRQSSSEVEIVERKSPAPATPSPSKTRVRPSARNKVPDTPSKSSPLKTSGGRALSENGSPPRTPSPSKPRPRPVARTAKTTQPSGVQPIAVNKFPVAVEQISPMHLSFEDERRASSDSDGAEISDPQFFEDAKSNVPDVDNGVEYDTDDYWHAVEYAVANEEADISPAPRGRSTKDLKGKAAMHIASDDDEVGRHHAAHGKKKAAMAVVSSESDDAGLSAHELQQIAEAKRQSLIGTALAARKGSASTVIQSAGPAVEDVFSGTTAKLQVTRASKLLKAMDSSAAKMNNSAAVVVDKNTVYLQDLEVGVRGEVGPAECQVKNPDDEDPGLVYTDLCNLFGSREFRSWSDAPHIGLGTFSAWQEQCPNLDKKQLKRIFEFREYQHIRNASRTVPHNLASKALRGGNTILIIAGSRDTVVQFSTILFVTASSRIHSLQEILKEERRAIQGVPQIVEWERMQSVLCMAHNIPYANINMKAGSITFCTGKTMRYSHAASGTSPAKNPDRFLKKRPLAPQAGDAISPFKVAKDTVTGQGFIPVLDARGVRFNLESDLRELDQKLPAFVGEVPEGSCAWVGYTSTKYETGDGVIGLNFNLMWVVVLGTP
ncbi:hypothetical protein HWV62_7940 [Athelia sp. TMB]|nr:hypothetical protein HWV62_7940 [Athelia sp. TMB]